MSNYLLASSSKFRSVVRVCKIPGKVTAAAVVTPRALLWGEKRRERIEAGERRKLGPQQGHWALARVLTAQLRRRLKRQQEGPGVDEWRATERVRRIEAAVAEGRVERWIEYSGVFSSQDAGRKEMY